MSQRILVIEGDPVLRDSMWRLLSDHGHQVELAANGAKAAERSLAVRFDTLIWDVSLIDIGAGLLTRLLETDGARGPAPSLIGLVEHRHSLEVSRVCGDVFKAILPKPFRSGALLDAISGASRRPTAMGAVLPLQCEGRNHMESPSVARDLSTAHWRRYGLQMRPRVFARPRPTMDQEKALKLCFDIVNPQDADLVILLERHGMSEAKRISASSDKISRPVIALSPDHADLCDAVFEITAETSWRKIASLVHRDRILTGVAPQAHAELAASIDVGSLMPQTHESDGDDISPPQKEPFDGVAKGLRISNQKSGQIVSLGSVGGGADVSRDHWTRPVRAMKNGDHEASSQGWNKVARGYAAAKVLLIEGTETGSPGLMLALARAGHIVCRVQDPQASMVAADGTLFDVGVIDMNASSESHIDLPGLVWSLRGVQRGLPIILVGAELGGKDRHDIARAGGVSLLAKASAQENLVEAVSAAISDGNSHSLLSGVHDARTRARLVSRETTSPGHRPE